MSSIDRRIIDRYFNNTCTPEEAKQVLKWFNTKEGQLFLESKLDTDISQMDDNQISYMTPDLDSGKMMRNIKQKVRKGGPFGQKKSLFALRIAAAAAVIIITASLTYLYYSNENNSGLQSTEVASTYYETDDDQQKVITLKDGSRVRMNGNSQLWVSGNFLADNREVKLTGEAYFDIEHQPYKPFIVESKRGMIQVLGTSFNVKALPEIENIQVAVIDGSVSLSSNDPEEDKRSVVLNKGQFGIMDPHEINIDDYGVQNYLMWMKGRLVFENLKLSQACTQLSRLYGIQCHFADEDLKDLRITTNMSVDTQEKVYTVISKTLDVEFQKDGKLITWLESE
ncbi:MAG: FecR domain-containing protein [Balneolales bacterium]